jgi:hypothetical protein
MLELLVAMAIFIVVSGAALSLTAMQMPVFNQQQNLAGLNIAVRRSVSQLQLDIVNAGNGTLLGPSMPNAPVGITIFNSMPSSPCNTPATFSYGANCFDTLNIIAADLTVVPAHPDNGTFVPNSGTNCINTSSATTLYLDPPAGNTNIAASALAGGYFSGDEVLLVNSNGSQMTTVKLTAAGAVSHVGALYGVKLAYNSTAATGVNPTANDPLLLTTTAGGPFGVQYCSAVDWVVRLDPITYQVNITNAADPQLVRLRGGANPQTLADQVIGFKVGAITWNAGFTMPDDTAAYNYFASNLTTNGTHPGYNNQFWLIDSVQVSLIARTTPNASATYVYQNGFDSGHYQIESDSVVVNPRNLTMGNN